MEAESRPRPSGRVLLVEDEPQVRAIACRVLSEDGYHVFEAEDGDEALEVLKLVGAVDLVLTDVVMPTMDQPACRCISDSARDEKRGPLTTTSVPSSTTWRGERRAASTATWRPLEQ